MAEEHDGEVKSYKELNVRPSRILDARRVARNLRPADRREIAAFTRESAVRVLGDGILSSSPCYTITLSDGRPIGIFGTRESDHPESALVWLLGTNDLVTHSKTFLRFSRHFLEQFHEKYRLLYNVIDARNTVHLRWLEWLGFDLVQEIPKYGVEQRTFILFRKYV